MSLGAVILCGGESKRMGQPKAWLTFGGERMLQRVVRLVANVVDDVAVVAAPGQELPSLPPSIILARDPVSGRGPLQGLAAGLGALPNRVELAYATATDVPFLEPGWITRLASLIGDQDLAIPHCQGYHHPLAALYRRARVIPAIQALLAANRLRPVFLMEDLPTRVVTEEELFPVDPRLGTLRNLNTPEEYHSALVEAGFASAANPATAESTPPPRIRVELFGVPRLRAGLAELIVEGFSLGDALTAVATACPTLDGTVLRGGRPLPAYAVNLNGDRFVTDPSTRLLEGDTLIVLDLDMGG